MLKLAELTKVYANNKLPSVDTVTLEAKPGEIFGFLGPNGAGKTTTIKMIAGILPITSGRISIADIDIATQPMEAKRHFGYVPDDHLVYDKLTGREYINFMADVYRVSITERRERADLLLEKFSLTKDFDKMISSYSHGMKQKIAIIGALIHQPDLWILDEPMTGLDPQSAFELKNLMREHTSLGKTVFFSTHVLEVAEKLCDRVAIINQGKIIAVGTMAEIKQFGGDLEDYFLKVTSVGGNVVGGV